MALMRWVITEDHRNKAEDTVPSRVGRGNFMKAIANVLTFQFRLYDDDGVLYYSGRCDDPQKFEESKALAPLNYGMADAGCTRMDYRKPGGGWQTL